MRIIFDIEVYVSLGMIYSQMMNGNNLFYEGWFLLGPCPYLHTKEGFQRSIRSKLTLLIENIYQCLWSPIHQMRRNLKRLCRAR